MAAAVKVYAADRGAAETQGAIWVGPGSAWWPKVPPAPPKRPAPAPVDVMRRMLTQAGVRKAARSMLAGKSIADGTPVDDVSVATLLAAAAGTEGETYSP